MKDAFVNVRAWGKIRRYLFRVGDSGRLMFHLVTFTRVVASLPRFEVIVNRDFAFMNVFSRLLTVSSSEFIENGTIS